MQKAIFVGDGQVELFKSMDALVGYIEHWLLEQTPCRAFAEDGTEYELFVAKGADVKYPLVRKTEWIEDFLHTGVRVLSEAGARRDELTEILRDRLQRVDRLSEDELEMGYKLEVILQLFEQRVGYTA